MMSVSTEPSLRFASCKILSTRCTWEARSRTSCLRVRVSIRRSCTGAGGTKLLRIRPCASKSATDVARITADTPIALFPVRIETRFDLTASPPVLKVRIYPDEIWINQHETALTRAEVDAAKQYYLDANANDGDASEPWRQIISKMSPERAAYVLRGMTPVTIIFLNKPAEETSGEGDLAGCVPSYTTVRRLMKERGLFRQKRRQRRGNEERSDHSREIFEARETRSFESEYVLAL